MGSEAGIVRKPRVLCLHGFRTSGEILKKQIGKWPQQVLDNLDLVFPNGAHPAQGKSDVEGIFDPPYYEWFQFNKVWSPNSVSFTFTFAFFDYQVHNFWFFFKIIIGIYRVHKLWQVPCIHWRLHDQAWPVWWASGILTGSSTINLWLVISHD